MDEQVRGEIVKSHGLASRVGCEPSLCLRPQNHCNSDSAQSLAGGQLINYLQSVEDFLLDVGKVAMSTQEPPDYHVYEWLNFERDTFRFYFDAIRFYASLLIAILKMLREDEDLQAILADRTLDSFPIAREVNRAQKMHQWFEHHFEKQGKDAPDYDVSLTHGTIRFIKSACVLYLEHLRRRRQVIAGRPEISKAMLEAVDQQLGRFEEKAEVGVFHTATPYPIALSQLPGPDKKAPAARSDLAAADYIRPRPLVLDSIEIRDPELRKRCLDLLAQFHDDGQHDRLDTVVREATNILEHRLRSLSKAPAGCSGVDLAKQAFGSTPNLVVSDIVAEQESAHLLYRGVFGFLRNSVHHRLVPNLQPERVLQIVGMVDYLISVAEAARNSRPFSKTESTHGRSVEFAIKGRKGEANSRQKEIMLLRHGFAYQPLTHFNWSRFGGGINWLSFLIPPQIKKIATGVK